MKSPKRRVERENRTEFCRKSLFKRHRAENLVSIEGVAGEEGRAPGSGGITGAPGGRVHKERRVTAESGREAKEGWGDGRKVCTGLNLLGTQGQARQGIRWSFFKIRDRVQFQKQRDGGQISGVTRKWEMRV